MRTRMINSYQERWSFSQGSLIRVLLFLTMVSWWPMQEVRADYLYKLKLKNVETNVVSDWTNWISVTDEDHNDGWGVHWHNSLRDYIENRKAVYDNLGNQIPCRYKDGYGNQKWCDDANESSFDNQIQYKVVGIKFKRGNNEIGDKGEWFEILEGDDYFYWQDGKEIEIFNRIKDEVLELDLSEWEKAFLGTKHTELHYFGEMVAMTTLYLPVEHEFAIGSEYLFANAYNLQNVVWGTNSKITEVGKGAFRNCFKLPQETIQRIINEVGTYSETGEIGAQAFYNCLQLEDVTIPARIRKIGYEAFCQRVETPSDLPSGYNQSILIPSLKTVTFQSSNDTYKKKVWDNYTYTEDDSYTWNGCQIDSVGNEVFAECQLLETVVLNNVQLKRLGYGVFSDCRLLSSSGVQSVLNNYATYGQVEEGEYLGIPAGLFWGVNGKKLDGTYDKRFTSLTIPEAFWWIGAGAFGVWTGADPDQPSIKDIYVSRGYRPDCLSSFADKPFYGDFTSFAGVVPNHCTIHFSGDAAKYSSSTESLVGYTNYQTDNSEFQRLLTKDMYSDATATIYDVEPQQHAIVRLHRTLKAGWNTICLPFGATVAAKEVPVKVEGEPTANSTIFKNTLNSNNGAGFMLAVYRDYLPSNNNFRFLRISDYDNVAIEPCVPFIIKMDASDLNSDNIYTFTNVDVNYKWNKDGETYNASITIPTSTVAEDFSGKTESFAPFNDGKGLNSDYVFTGTFKTMTGTVGNNDAINGFITTNDYYMQNNGGTAKYYQYESGKKVGIKAFTGWFHYTGSLSGAKMSSIDMGLFDGFETTSIPNIEVMDASNFDSNIYNINGVLIGKRADVEQTLPKGVYISDGKKFIVK